VLEKVGRHFRLLERIADAHRRHVLEKDMPELIHRLRVYFKRLL
jgi:hypothetical protein